MIADASPRSPAGPPVAPRAPHRPSDPTEILRNLLAIWRETELAGRRPIGFDVSDSERLTPQDDNALDSNGWGLILRILIVVFLGVLFWQAVLVSGRL